MKAKSIGTIVGLVLAAPVLISFYLSLAHAYVQGIVVDTLQQVIAAMQH